MSGHVVIIDIDGTLTKVSPHRLKFIKNGSPDWDKFHSLCTMDRIDPNITRLLRSLDSDQYRKIVLTGRSDNHRKVTEEQLSICDIDHETILMRPQGDFRPDHVVKMEILVDYGITPGQVSYVFEDRQSMVNKWREVAPHALVMQVAEGDF